MNNFYSLGFFIIFSMLSTSATAEENVSGIWKGTNYADKVGKPAEVTLTLKQSGQNVSGDYVVKTGALGSGSGSIEGQIMRIEWDNKTPGCKGHYSNIYLVSGNHMSWVFQGEDCLGVYSK